MKVSAVIPAYNEEKTLSNVLDPLKKVKEIGEILVISDGSTDNTVDVSRNKGVKVIELTENIGKGGAMVIGVKNAKFPVVLFLDADLLGLTSEHVKNLIDPVLYENYSMSIGVFEKGRVTTDLAQYVAPFLSGQRAVKKELIDEVFDLGTSRFGVEVALTQYAKEKKLPVKEVHLYDMSHVMKEEKLGFKKGFMARMKMYWDIAKIVSKNVKIKTKN